MLIYRSIGKVNKLFFNGDLLDNDIEYVNDNKLAIKHSKYYTLLNDIIFEEGEVHVNINNKDYIGQKLKKQYLGKIKDGDSFSVTYPGDGYELGGGTLNINVIGDYVDRGDELMSLAGESLIDDMTYVIYKNLFQKSIMKKVVYEFVDKKKGKYKFVDWIIIDIVGTEDNNISQNGIIKDEKKYYQDILKSEWKQGYWNTQELLYTEGGQSVPVKLGHNQEIELNGKLMTLYDMYSPQIRLAMLKGIYSDTQIEKAKSSGTLKTLQHWQYDVIKDFGHVNVVAAVRRAGKGQIGTEFCLTKDKGLIRFNELEVGDYILGSNYKWTRIKNIRKEVDDAVEVVLNNGVSFISTTEHPVPTHINYNPITDEFDKDRDDYKRAVDLGKGDYVAFMGGYDIDNTPPNVSELDYLLKYKENGGLRSIPSEIYTFPKKYRYALLGGLLLTDGYLGIKNKAQQKDGYKRRKNGYIEYVNKDEVFIRQVCILLSSLGIPYRTKTRTIKSNYLTEAREYYYIYIESYRGIENIINNCGKYLEGKKNFVEFVKTISNIDETMVNSNTDKIPLYFRGKYGAKLVEENGYNGNMFGGIKKNRSNGTAPQYNFQRWKAKYYHLENTLKYSWVEVKNVKRISKTDIVHVEVEADDSLFFGADILQHNSFLSALIAVRELLKENYSPKPTRILYYGLSVGKTKTVIDYLLSLTKDFRKFKMFQRRQSERTLSFIDPDSKDTIGSIEFHSAQEDEAGVGEYANLIIIDEAARFPEYVYDSMKAIIFSEGAKAFIISTINWDTSKNWFYQELLKAEKENVKRKGSNAEYEAKTDAIIEKVNEKGYDYFLKNKFDISEELNKAIFNYKRYVAWRVVIDDIDRMPDYKKKALISELKDNPLRYFTEVYCIYPSENKVFNYEAGLTDVDKDEVLNKRKYQKIYVGYDPALTSDNAGITSVGVYRDELGKLKFEIFDSIFIDPNRGMRYQEQVQYVTKIIQGYKTVCPDTYLCVDAGGVGMAVMENFGEQSIDFPIKSSGSGNLHRENGVWIAPKELMVLTVKNLFDEGYIRTNKKLKNLLVEIDYFKKKTTAAGNNKYEAEVGHDDLVTSMMISIFSAFEIDALKNELVVNDVKTNNVSGLTYEQISKMQQETIEQNNKDNIIKSSNNFLSKFGF